MTPLILVITACVICLVLAIAGVIWFVACIGGAAASTVVSAVAEAQKKKKISTSEKPTTHET